MPRFDTGTIIRISAILQEDDTHSGVRETTVKCEITCSATRFSKSHFSCKFSVASYVSQGAGLEPICTYQGPDCDSLSGITINQPTNPLPPPPTIYYYNPFVGGPQIVFIFDVVFRRYKFARGFLWKKNPPSRRSILANIRSAKN